MSAEVVRHPGAMDIKNAQNRAKWSLRYFGGEHFPDLRTVEQFRMGEWIELQARWLRRGYRLLLHEVRRYG